MIRRVPKIVLAALIVFSCSTDEESITVGSFFVTDREWAEPRQERLPQIERDTYFEAAVSSGLQEELLLGERRKFRFECGVRFDEFPAKDDSLVSVRLSARLAHVEGAAELIIQRIAPSEDWTERSSIDSVSLATTLDTSITILIDPGSDSIATFLPIDWVRSWIDSSATNDGLLFSLADYGGVFIRIPSREDPDSTAGQFLLTSITADTAGIFDTTIAEPVADRFFAFKQGKAITPPYVVENDPSDTLLLGSRESMSNQLVLEITIPDSLHDYTVNRAELRLTTEAVRMDDSSSITIEVHEVNDDGGGNTDAIIILNAIAALATYDAGEAGDTIVIPMTNIMRTWYRNRDWDPQILLRTDDSQVKNRHVVIQSIEFDTGTGPLVDLLYTPLRPVENQP